MTTTPHLEHVAPALLTTEHNVRKDLRLEKDFLKSIKQSGVLEPIVAFPDPLLEGHYRVHLGHRRTVAAVEANLDTVPVYVITEREAAERIAEQLVENQHRTALRPDEVTGAYEQLSLFGMSAMQISKRTSTPLAKVGDALTVAKSTVASKVLAEHQVTIEEALVFDEFADDEEALGLLIDTIETKPGQLAHQAQLIRNDRAEAASHAALEQEIVEAGIRAVPVDQYGQVKDYKAVTSLRIGKDYYGPGAKEELTLETALAEAGDDLGARPAWTWGRDDNDRNQKVWRIEYYVRNHRDHGWCHYNDRGEKAPLTDEQKDDRRIARENGKLWLAATEVRTAWLTQLLQRRTLPTEWPTLPGLFAARNSELLRYGVKNLAAELLGVPHPEFDNNTLAELVETNTQQAGHLLLALGVAAIEKALDPKQGWQTKDSILALYLRQLAAWGYTLSDLEEQIVTTALAGEVSA